MLARRPARKDHIVARLPVYHLTAPKRLPLIEEEGLRTRADLSSLLGAPGPFDQAAPGVFANGKRVSAYLDLDHARTHVAEHGAGLVTYTVDPRKALAVRSSKRDDDPEAYWAAARPLSDWEADGDLPDDLEVHVNVGVRAKFLELKAPLFGDDDLGDYAAIVNAVADEDRLSAKALMHLAVIASAGDFESNAFNAACALAWRDAPDPDDIVKELVELDADKIASAAVAEFGAESPEAAAELREALESTRLWADDNGLPHGRGILARTAFVLDQLPTA